MILTGLHITADASNHHLEMVLPFDLVFNKSSVGEAHSRAVIGTATPSLSAPLISGMLPFIAGVTTESWSKKSVAVPCVIPQHP